MSIISYYANYHGHQLNHLKEVLRILKSRYASIVYLAGDSSMDNKAWINHDKADPCPQYESIVDQSVQDVCHWTNFELAKKNNFTCCINCAIEESALGERDDGLLQQDKFIRDNITKNDVLVISVGGNDIALKPTKTIMFNMASIVLLPLFMINYNPSYYYFVNLFHRQIESYIKNLTSKEKPKQIILAGIYFPCTKGKGWADTVLKLTGYNSNPEKLQYIIKSIFTDVFVKLNSQNVKYMPMYEILDCNDPSDYVARVEPSSQGGHKIAKVIVSLID